MKTLSIKECLTFGWGTFRTRAWFFMSATALLFIASMVYGELSSFSKADHTFIGFVAGIIALVLSLLIYMSQVSFSLHAHDAPGTVRLNALWTLRPFWTFMGTALLVWIITMIGFVLLIVPGVIAMVFLSFATYIAVDTGAKPIDALKRSIALTKGNRWKLFLLLLACIGIDILGALALLVGLLVSVPITLLAMAHAYRVLRNGQEEVPAVEVRDDAVIKS
jgi:Predicted integral membrane protein